MTLRDIQGHSPIASHFSNWIIRSADKI